MCWLCRAFLVCEVSIVKILTNPIVKSFQFFQLLGYVATAANKQLVSTSILLVISFFLFFSIILYHIHLKVKPNVDVEKYYWKYKNVLQAKIFSESASTADGSLHNDYGSLQQNNQYRERLLDNNFLESIDDN